MTASTTNEPLIFFCTNCGKHLSVSRELAGVSGPCPSCRTIICAPEAPVEINFDVVSNPLPKKNLTENLPKRQRRGHIPADSILDHRHADQREATKTLAIITLSILVICACLAIAWFLKDLKAK